MSRRVIRAADPKIMTLFAVTVLAGACSIGAVYAGAAEPDGYPYPLQQQMDGAPLDAIQCNAPRELHIIDSQTPVCISGPTYEALLGRGVDLAPYQSLSGIVRSITDAGDSDVQNVVEAAVSLYGYIGEGAFASINALSGDAVSHYPFVLDPDTGMIVAHGASPEKIGTPSAVLGEFAARPAGDVLDELQNGDGAWTAHVFVDPATGEEQIKRSWLTLHGGYVFGAGYSYPAHGRITDAVDNAIALYNTDRNALARIGAQHGDSAAYSYPYLLVIDPYTYPTTGQAVAHGGFTGGTQAAPIPTDVGYGDLAASMIDGNQAVRLYSLHTNHETGTDKQNLYLGMMRGGYMFGAGYSYSPEEKARGIVQDAIALYGADGTGAFASINALPADVDPHYPFVLDADTKSVVAHGAFPNERVGTPSMILVDQADRPALEILADLQDGGTWIEHEDRVPGTDIEERKRSYLQLHDGYIFGSGYYYATLPVLESAEPDVEIVAARTYADPTVVTLPKLEYEDPYHEFDMNTGNAMYGVVLPHVAGWLRQDVSPNVNDAPFIFRYGVLLTNAAFDAVAPYHPTAVGVYSRMEHRPASESADNLLPNTAIMYSTYRSMLEFAPDRADEWRYMMTIHQLDPDDDSGLDLDCGRQHDLDSPAAIGNLAAKCVLDARRNDGFNHFGDETPGTPFGDSTGYRPFNPPNILRDQSRWQPLTIYNDDGTFGVQTFVTPQYANTEPYSDIDPRSFRVLPPTDSNYRNTDAYLAQVDEVLALTANLTDAQKMEVEYFDNKVRETLFQPALKNIHDVVKFVQLDFLIHMAEFDSGIITWQEKARYDAVRPVTAIGYLYGDEPVTRWSIAGVEQEEVSADRWRSYVNTADHPEYPSASTAFCAAYAEVWRQYAGTDTIPDYVGPNGGIIHGYGDIRPAGSSTIERGVTPVSGVTLSFDSWTDFENRCAASRVLSGTHFWPAVEVSIATGNAAGAAAFEYWETLIHDEPPIREAAQERAPDPLLNGPFWTRR